MRILVSGATKTVRRLARQFPHTLGVLITPQNWNSIARVSLPYACDNAAFSNPDDEKFWSLSVDAWNVMTYHPPLWVAAPDVVGNHDETRTLFDSWVRTFEEEIGHVPFPLAFVLQDGAREDEIPWHQIAAVFVGGSTEFKLRQSAPLIEAAKQRGKLVHIGRVNSLRRLRFAHDIGADTVDGTSFSMFPDTKIEPALRHIAATTKTKTLF